MKWLKNLLNLFKSKPKKQILSEDLARQRINEILKQSKK